MTKVLTMILTLVLLALPVRSCAEAASDKKPEDEPAKEAVWIPAEDPTVTEEIDSMVQESLNGLVGVSYRPVAYLGACRGEEETQHAVLCQARVVVPGAEPRFVIFYLTESGQGDIKLMKIADFEIDACLKAG